jgi:hypothetical protein
MVLLIGQMFDPELKYVLDEIKRNRQINLVPLPVVVIYLILDYNQACGRYISVCAA